MLEPNSKPPFPAYPSGHATFGGACFQMVRLFYKARDNLSFAPDAPDDIAFVGHSDELNGISRDLTQPFDVNQPITDQQGIVRSNVTLHFASLWAASELPRPPPSSSLLPLTCTSAVFHNALSRVFLGVHWGFDAFAADDVLKSKDVQPDGEYAYKDPQDVRYATTGTRKDRPGQTGFPFGGVPLGIGIANDIWQGKLKPTPVPIQPSGRSKCGDPRW